MAHQTRRPQVAGLFYFEAMLDANEVIVIPINRNNGHNGDSRISIQAAAGTKVAATAIHPTVALQVCGNQRYVSSVAGDYPATPTPDKPFRWSADQAIAADWNILDFDTVASAIRITAPAGGTHLVMYGDY